VRLLQGHSKYVSVGKSPLELLERAARSRRPKIEAGTRVRMAKQLRDHEIERLVARYRETRNMRQVAREFRMSRTTIAKHLATHGIDTSRRMKPTDIKQAVTLYAEGLSSMTIGKQLGFDNHTVLSALRAEGVQIRTALGR